MNFKEIQLVGFKSFADKTNITFDDGVTCIVGPNGCGKSNVSDAVRWVLGEQSAKNMRGTSMTDVIFNGTTSRRALSYCEVTLVFDNKEKLFDIEYEEVAMTRRLYRSGESEYLLNKQPCRLKDIVALLHGVGIGKEGYSIIGQGKVEQIMNAKPEDRRAIFEEATGVMAFKGRKAEIERKLESAKDNLTVFVQRMDEAEKQIKPLEKQALTAKKYREFSEELKYNEVNSYILRVENAAFETVKFREKIASAEERIAEIEKEIAVIDADDAKARERLEGLDGELRELNGQRLEYEVGIEHRNGEAKVLNERISSFRQQLNVASDDIEYSLRRIKEIDGLTVSGRKKMEEMGKRSREINKQCDELKLHVTEVDARISVYEKMTNEQRESEMNSVESLSELRAESGSLSAKLASAQERIEEVRTAIEKATARKEELSAELEKCRAEKATCEKFLNEKDEKGEELDGEVRALATSVHKLSQDYMDCNASISNLEHSLEMYVGLKNRFDGYRDSVRRLQLTAKNDKTIGAKIKGAIADIVSTDQKYEVAIETAFGGAMQNLVTANADDSRFLIEFLKKTGGGVVTFLPVSSMKPHYDSGEIKRAVHERGAVGLATELVKYDPYYDSVIRNLLGNTLICDTIGNATSISKKFDNAFRIVTLDGDQIATSGAMTGGSRRKDSGNLLAGERHIKECEENIARKKSMADRLKLAISNAENDRDEAQKALDEFRIKVQEEVASFAALSQRENALEGLLADRESELNEFTAFMDSLNKRANDLDSEVQSNTANEDVLSRIRMEAQAELTRQQEECDKLRAERQKLDEEYHTLYAEGVALLSAKEAEEGNILRIQEEKRTLSEKIDRTRKNIAQTEVTIDNLSKEREKAALTEEEQRIVADIRARIEKVEEEKKTLASEQLQRSEAKRDVQIEEQKTLDLKYKCENEINKIESGLLAMQERVAEEYDLTYETALPLRDENYDIAQSYTAISNLKRQITMLGPVNMNAEEDYDNLSNRYGEMKMQREDLEKGIEDLTLVLTELRGEMQRKFDEGFATINENFKQTFRALFGGGKAEMQLDYVEGEDPLNAGVEIIACPPGKKLTKISLLSGGERALTAIAILFAILKARPMPFCILDEIEAALDEANVDLFAKYLKNFSKDTQFIVITHRKPTMNQADTLFGVTMEEKGVSKIVSVKLSEVEQRLGGDTVVA